MDSISLIKDIFNLADAIYQQIKKANANQAQCQRLGERINVVMSSLKGLNEIPQTQNFKDALIFLKNNLEECRKFINKFCDRTWFKRVIKAGNDAKKFTDLNQSLQQSLQQLSLGIQVQQLADHADDLADQQKDEALISELLEKILGLHQAEKEKLISIRNAQGKQELAQQEQAQLLMKQIASVKKHLLNQQKFFSIHLPKQAIVSFHELDFHEKMCQYPEKTVYTGSYKTQTITIEIYHLAPEQNILLENEVIKLHSLRHSHLLPFYGICLEEERVLVWKKATALAKLLPHRFTNELVKQVLEQVAQGLLYLHEQRLNYGSFSLNEIYLDSYQQAYLSNFSGCADHRLSKLKCRLEPNSPWVAPEIRKGLIPSNAADIYSFGWLMWCLLSNCIPFQGSSEEQIKIHLSKGEREKIPADFHLEYISLINACWQENAANRPSMVEVIARLSNLKPDLTIRARVRPAIEDFKSDVQPKALSPRSLCNIAAEYEQKNENEKARNCYIQAADQGYIQAKVNLSLFLLKGKGGKQDVKKGMHLLQEAAKSNNIIAQFNLGKLLKDKDRIKAMFWFKKAANSGDSQAQEELNNLEKIQQFNKK